VFKVVSTVQFVNSDVYVCWQVKNHVWVFVNALIENPTFDSQTKENMTLQPKSFGSTCNLSEKFINAVGINHRLGKYCYCKNHRSVDVV